MVFLADLNLTLGVARSQIIVAFERREGKAEGCGSSKLPLNDEPVPDLCVAHAMIRAITR